MNLRQKQILQRAECEGEITIKALADVLGVSEMTIHRDVDVLQKQHYVYKKRGAVVYVENSDRAKTDFYVEEKRAIGIKAASLIEEGQSVIFDNSTTALECAKYLAPSGKYTFYATGLETAAILSRYENSVLYVSGGYYFPASKGLVGSVAESFVGSVRADICIVGASGVSVEGGVTTPYPMHTALQKTIIAAAKTKILVCDHSKFDKRAMENICDLKDIDILVTDSGILEKTHEKYSKYLTLIKA